MGPGGRNPEEQFGRTLLEGLWSGEPFTHHGEHFTVNDTRFVPTAIQQPRVPVWASCTVPHTAPLRRAARWDGVILAQVTEGGNVDPVPLDIVRDAVDRLPTGEGFDVVAGHPGLPSDDHLAELSGVGATRVHVTGWLEELDGLVGQPLAAVRR